MWGFGSFSGLGVLVSGFRAQGPGRSPKQAGSANFDFLEPPCAHAWPQSRKKGPTIQILTVGSLSEGTKPS